MAHVHGRHRQQQQQQLPWPLRIYLVAYNWLEAAGWAIALCLTAAAMTLQQLQAEPQQSKEDSVYRSARWIVDLCQLTSGLEVVHALVGLVRTGWTNALMQWAGRTHVLYGVLHSVPQIQSSYSVAALFLSWSLSEIIRYPQYALSLTGACPHWLTWLRYSAFIVLYPIGVLSEMYMIVRARPYAEQVELHASVFRHLPFNYSTFLLVLLLAYPLLWAQLYLHLLRQRRSKLSSAAHKKE